MQKNSNICYSCCTREILFVDGEQDVSFEQYDDVPWTSTPDTLDCWVVTLPLLFKDFGDSGGYDAPMF